MSNIKQIVIYKKHHKLILCKKCSKDISDLGYGQRVYCDPCRILAEKESHRKAHRKIYVKKVTKHQIIINALKRGPKTGKELTKLTNTKNILALMTVLKKKKHYFITSQTNTTYTLRPSY